MSDLEIQKKGAIERRLAIVRKNSTELQPIGEQLRKNALDFNEQRAVRGVDAKGRNLAQLKPSTLEHRKGSGPPLAPDSAGSGIVTDCHVEVEYGPGVAIVKKSWPNLHWLKYAIKGNSNMAPRDPTGYSREEKQKFGEILKKHLTKKS